ncbi:MAG: BamA/TamA family outer membrane protein [Cyclobacteriaceae bacterium]|nr:BamA/TamA family outer membrane protein [Cyclobacteriaceae bacterium]
MKHLIITFLLSLVFCASYAQQKPYVIEIIESDESISKLLKGRADSIKFQQVIKSEYEKLVRKGYVLATLSQLKPDSLLLGKIAKGEVYRWGYFNINSVPEALLSRVGYQKRQFDNTRVSPRLLGELMVKIIEESDKTGYPFAVARLDSVRISKSEIFAVLDYNSGQQIKYGALEVNADLIKGEYLESYLNLKEGDVFSGNKIADISKKIKNLSYCKLKRAPSIRFENKTCIITLNIVPVKANKVDAMLGLAPNQIDQTKLLATGYVNLDLHNLFRSGKRLSFNWRQFGVQSQTLRALYNHTNIFGSEIDVKGVFDLFKQDTTFINRNFYLNIGYSNADYTINFTSSFITSRLLSPINITDVSNLTLIDFNAQYYGVELLKYEFDNIINPKKGWGLRTGVNLGAKNIINSTFVPAEVYDSLKSQSLQGNFTITSDVAIPVSSIGVAYAKLEVGTIPNNGKLFVNDLFRLGGVNSIRGFNELEIYASTYALLQVEGRLILGENSRLFGFADWAYTTNEVTNLVETFLGLGAGLLLDTPSGVIQLVYAVGKSSKQSLSLTESKIHVGYVARF